MRPLAFPSSHVSLPYLSSLCPWHCTSSSSAAARDSRKGDLGHHRRPVDLPAPTCCSRRLCRFIAFAGEGEVYGCRRSRCRSLLRTRLYFNPDEHCKVAPLFVLLSQVGSVSIRRCLLPCFGPDPCHHVLPLNLRERDDFVLNLIFPWK